MNDLLAPHIDDIEMVFLGYLERLVLSRLYYSLQIFTTTDIYHIHYFVTARVSYIQRGKVTIIVDKRYGNKI